MNGFMWDSGDGTGIANKYTSIFIIGLYMIQITGKIAYENPSEYTQIYIMWNSGNGKGIADKYSATKQSAAVVVHYDDNHEDLID